jgi:hypothetical protein
LRPGQERHDDHADGEERDTHRGVLGPVGADQGAQRLHGDVGGEREERPGVTRNAIFSRCSWSGPANCQATAAAELTSITESSPNPISAIESAMVPR